MFNSGIVAQGVLGPSLSDTILSFSPWGYWKLNETGTLTTAADSSGNARHGTHSGSGSTSASALIGGSSGACTFNGSGKINLPTHTRTANTAHTILFWVRNTTSSAGMHYVACHPSGSSGVMVRKEGTQLRHVTLGNTALDVVPTPVMNVEATVMIAAVFDPALANADGRMKTYVDGVEVARTTTGANAAGTSYQWAISSQNNAVLAFPVIGTMSDVAIYTTPLSAANISEIWAAKNR